MRDKSPQQARGAGGWGAVPLCPDRPGQDGSTDEGAMPFPPCRFGQGMAASIQGLTCSSQHSSTQLVPTGGPQTDGEVGQGSRLAGPSGPRILGLCRRLSSSDGGIGRSKDISGPEHQQAPNSKGEPCFSPSLGSASLQFPGRRELLQMGKWALEEWAALASSAAAAFKPLRRHERTRHRHLPQRMRPSEGAWLTWLAGDQGGTAPCGQRPTSRCDWLFEEPCLGSSLGLHRV